MKQILVPTDFSENSFNALAYAVAFYKNTACTFYLMNIGSLSESGIVSNGLALNYNKVDTHSKMELLEENIKEISKKHPSEQHQFYGLQEFGNFIDIIRKTILEKKIDLIVMGTKGTSTLKNTFIGSNTEDVITKVAANLLIVPQKCTFQPIGKVAFPTNFNNFYSFDLLESLTEILRISNGELEVMSVMLTDQLNNSQEKNKNYLHEYLDEVFEERYHFYSEKNKNIKDAIEDFTITHAIDMTIMAAKNLNYLQQLLFNSTIKRISRHTKIPVFVLHE
ncbi:universal stress protein [Cellulophaga sp. Z1A5H]|uniref:universal stress protein n=1 Tax=Cellulophaga sp. Z1A5H TaxID=2687291 RepID=UPI0013FD495C|nr:universal stress protein [Cellulophaga sp. Z1A5H]